MTSGPENKCVAGKKADRWCCCCE